MKSIRARLFAMGDAAYLAFHAKLVPTVDKARIIGVRTPQLRRFAKEIFGSEAAADFMRTLPHEYYDEDNLHAFLLEQIPDFSELICEIDNFLPYVDNWATCDMMSPKAFKKHLPELLCEIKRWLSCSDVYTVRFAIVTLMKHYLQDHFSAEHLEWLADIQSGEYYIKMAVAWYFATALAYQQDAVMPYLTEGRLDDWTHNKTIRKACESYRLTDGCKNYLKTLKR